LFNSGNLLLNEQEYTSELSDLSEKSEKFKYSDGVLIVACKVGVFMRDEEGCCNLIGLVNVDERGQLVLPKDLRERAGIKAGSKLAIMTSERNGKVCCITMIKADDLADTLKKKLGPILNELFK
jgi:AbrB family looped-hinge helix DNA binding protein